MGKGKILFVDASVPFSMLCAEALELAGYSVDVSPNLEETGDLLEKSIYSLVISEVKSPGVDGVSFYEETVKEYPYLEKSFLFIAGKTSKEAIKALARDKRKYIIKPFKVSKLVEMAGKLASKPVKKGVSTRKEARLDWKVECEVSSVDIPEKLAVKSKDISRNGILVEYVKGMLMPETPVKISININEFALSRKATVVWSRRMGGQIASGLLFAEPVSLAAIMAFSQHANNALSN